MGNYSSSPEDCSDALQKLYGKAWAKHMHHAKTGGSELANQGFVSLGGYSSLEDYGNSVYSEAKEKLIRGIASDVATTLKVKSDWANTASIKDVVEKLKSIVPNTKHKKSLKPSDTFHKEICAKLAHSINKRYDMEVIDLSADAHIICNHVSEILYSLFAGLHSEFLTVSGDVSRILRNLRVLQEYVNEANKKLIDTLNKNAEGTDPEADSIKKLYDTLSKEIDRQETILANLVDSVIGPVGESLVTLLEDNDDFKGLTTDLEKLTGTTEFGDKLGFLLRGTANVSHAAEVVDKALKKIGMSVKEYKDVKGLRELREKVTKQIENKKPTSGELYKLLAAADVIYKNDIHHEDIIGYLNKKSGGMEHHGGSKFDEYDISFADTADIQTAVDKEDNPLKGRTQTYRKSITKQLDQKKNLRKQLFSVLNDQIKDGYDKIKFTLAKLSKKIGIEIELTPELDMFIRQLNNFSNAQPDRHNIHIALSGFRKDIGSDYVKYQFMENLQAIVEAAEEMEKTKAGQYFKEIKNSIISLLDIIFKFNETFTNTLSDIHVESVGVKHKDEKSGGDCGCAGGDEGAEFDIPTEEPVHSDGSSVEEHFEEHVEGGSSLTNALGGVVAFIPENEFNHFKTMKKSIREIDYYYRIAGIKANMNKVSAEFENNTENYENILGEEAGYYIDQIQKKYNDLIALTDSNTDGDVKDKEKLYCHGKDSEADGLPDGLKTSLAADIKAHSTTDVLKKATKDYLDGYKFLLEYIRASKIEMFEAAQALDIYLSKFTKSMQFKPDQIKEFVQILEQIEVVAKWFTDKSGDNLVNVFEEFGTIKLDGTEHYYMKVKDTLPGKFYINKLMTREEAIEFVKKIEKSIKSVRALENIIATFSRVNTNVSAEVKTFMSSGTMFKAFMNYSIASVISVGHLTLNNDKNIMKNSLDSGDESTELKRLKAKMGVGLQFNKEYMKLTNSSYLQLCDPLDISATVEGGKFEDPCDRIFEMCVKSLIAKVFTIVGSYALFNKPAKLQENSLSLSTNPLRQILGGAASHIKVIPEATELYVRLPLLVEWYRSVFEFNETDKWVDDKDSKHQDDPLISIIPDMDTIWGDLCKVIFLDARSISDGAYPTEYANRIIEAINNIYTHYKAKHPSISVREIIMEFVLEINRRYGLIMRNEINAYLEERSSYITDVSKIDEEYPDDDNVEYNLVDIESNIGRRPAPSDKFRAFAKKSTTRKYGLNDLFKVAKRFRESIDANLSIINNDIAAKDADKDGDYFRTIANVSLTGIIGETKKKINVAPSSEDKYQIIHEQLHGIEKFGDVDQQKLLLFHETVITPLTVLYFTYRILNDFNKFFITINDKSKDRFKGKDHKYKTEYITKKNGDVYDTAMKTAYDGATLVGDNAKNNNKLELILRRLMNIGCDMNELTEINFVGGGATGNYPYIVYDKLEEMCSTLFNDAKSAFHQLRKFLPSSIIKEYEDYQDGKITLFYIQEHLFDRLFNNKYGNGLVDANISIKETWSDLIEDKIGTVTSFNDTFSKLGFWKSTNDCDFEPIKRNDSLKFPYQFIQVFNSGSSLGNPIDKVEKSIITSSLVSGNFEFNPTEAAKVNEVAPINTKIALMLTKGTGVDEPVVYYNSATPLTYNMYLGTKRLYSDIKDNISLGLICKLNNLIYKYCSIFTDPATTKIYRPLIEKFINGHNAKDILDGKNINDLVYKLRDPTAEEEAADADAPKKPIPSVSYTEPAEGAVLFASLAGGLKGLLYSMADKTFGVTNVYTEESFLKISDYQKELMRANLPAFEKELSLIIKKAEFLQRCLEETKVNVKAPAVTKVNIKNNYLLEKYTQPNKIRELEESSEKRKTYLVGIFDDISSTAKSLKRCIDDVQKELGDVPKYFEVYQDSIVDYNNQNRRLPFMPISHITNLMNFDLQKPTITYAADGTTITNTKYDHLSLIPDVNMGAGSAQYKFTYGTRGLLHYKQKPSLEFAPGVEALLTSYNEKMGGAASFDKNKMSDITVGTIMLSRFVLDFMYHKQVLDKADYGAMKSLLPAGIKNLSCQSKADANTWSITNVVALVENDSRKQIMDRMITCINIGGSNKLISMERSKFRVFNILDLNIVPINIHAMQREVPFVNLLNYSFTFDHIVKNFIGKDTRTKPLKDIEDLKKWDKDEKPEDTMVRQLIFPLGYRLMQEYTHNTFRIMAGNTSFGLNRPKYLSDQLWNKVLLNSFYEKDEDTKQHIPFVKKVGPDDVNENFTYIEDAKALSGFLTFINNKKEVKDVSTTDLKKSFEGYIRYNSKLVRWVEWFVQLQRVIRMLMRSQLEWISDPVVQGNDAISKDVTEYRDTNVFTIGDFE